MELLSTFIEEETLSKELSRPGHPYSTIIESFISLMENKYKMMADKQHRQIQNISMESLCDHLKRDFKMVVTFLQMSSTPFIEAFGVKGA